MVEGYGTFIGVGKVFGQVPIFGVELSTTMLLFGYGTKNTLDVFKVCTNHAQRPLNWLASKVLTQKYVIFK